MDAALVRAGQVDALVERIRERRYDFVALDSIFTVPTVERLKEACPDTPILVGGTNALPLLLFAPADYAIVGPGREAMRAFVDSFAGGSLPGDVPNLWFPDARRTDRSNGSGPGSGSSTGAHSVRSRSGLGLRRPRAQPRGEHAPPERRPGAGVRVPGRLALRAGVRVRSRAAPRARSWPSCLFRDRARDGIREFLDNTRGCAFCAFRFQSHVVDRADDAAERAAQQIARSGRPVRRSRVQRSKREPVPVPDPADRENPLGPIFPWTRSSSARFPIVLARNPKERDRGNRGRGRRRDPASPAAARLRELRSGRARSPREGDPRRGEREGGPAALRVERRFGDVGALFGGHGFILFTPWTRPEDVAENIRIVRDEAPFLAGSLGLASRLCFYDPFNPIYRLAESQGLARRSARDYGLDFRFADDRTELMCRLALSLERELVRNGEEAGPGLARAVLTAVVPQFGGNGPAAGRESAAAVFRATESRAKENLARDSELWPGVRR